MSTSDTVHVTHIASGDLWAGAEVQLYTLCKALCKKQNVVVQVILLNPGTLEKKLRELDLDVIVFDESLYSSIKIGWLIFRHLRTSRPDIVHTHRIKENVIGGTAAWLNGIPSLRTVHGAPEHSPGWLRPHKRLFYITDWYIGITIQDSIIAVSEDLKMLLEPIYPAEKIYVVENGIDIDAISSFTKSAVNATASSKPSCKIGIVGRLVPVKRVDLFIKTARQIRNDFPELPFNFHIFGDGPLRHELESLTIQMNLNDIIHFEGHCTDIHTEIASLDALLITSDHEGLPMTLLEAMALGTPVVAHSVGGIGTACHHGECCWLVAKNTVENLSQTIMACLKNETERKTRVTLAQERIHMQYSAELNAQNYLKSYLRITKKKSQY